MTRMELLGGWVRHARRMAPGIDRTDLEAAGLELLARYEEPHRAYHDQRHLSEVLAAVALLAEHAHDLSAVVLAAWWHDAVYEIGADDNEEASARLATATLAGWESDPDRVLHVGDLVRMTARHAPGEHDADGKVLSDADLAVLASPEHRYSAYVVDVRREYAAVPDVAFRAGRSALLRGLLDRPAIYRTPSAHERWEASARANLEAELRDLA
jgi:predicted metal-dependent HD superfamily phosphohydrolase